MLTMVTQSDEHFATKADITRLDGKNKLLANLVLGLYAGFAVFFCE